MHWCQLWFHKYHVKRHWYQWYYMTKKSCCFTFWSSWPNRCNSAIDDAICVMILTLLPWHHNTKKLKEYIAESGRSFGERLKEHLRAPSPKHYHSHTMGHPVNPECFTIVDRESQGISRNIKEAMYSHVNEQCLNRNLGKYQLPHIWDEVLWVTPSLQLN